MKKTSVLLGKLSALLLFVVLCSSAGRVVKKSSIVDAKTGWEKSFYYAMHKAESKSLSLESYRYLGAVKNEKKKAALLDEIFSEDAYMVVGSGNRARYKIMTYGECINLTPAKNKDLYAPRRMNVASAIAKKNIGVVELRWKYKGKKFKSKAIVETDGKQNFIYDNIMTYAPTDNDAAPGVIKRTHKVNGKIVKQEIEMLP